MSEADVASARIELVARVEGCPPITADIGEITVERGADGLVDEDYVLDATSQLLAAAAEELAVDGALRAPSVEKEGYGDGDAAVC